MSYVKLNNNYRSFDGLMKDIFNEFPATISKTVREDVLNYPPVNITDKPNLYLVELNAPGYIKADFNIKLEASTLTISTTQKEESVVEGEKTIRKEFAQKAFKRSFTINEKIDTEQIVARYENGILQIDLPKKENAATAAKDISIQ